MRENESSEVSEAKRQKPAGAKIPEEGEATIGGGKNKGKKERELASYEAKLKREKEEQQAKDELSELKTDATGTIQSCRRRPIFFQFYTVTFLTGRTLFVLNFAWSVTRDSLIQMFSG